MKAWLRHLLGALAGLALADHWASGIEAYSWVVLVTVALVLSLLRVLLRPLLILLTLPFVILTLGLGIWFINAFLLWLVAEFVPGFTVASAGSALWGALLISLVSWLVDLIWHRPHAQIQLRRARKLPSWHRQRGGSFRGRRGRRSGRDHDDVIDV